MKTVIRNSRIMWPIIAVPAMIVVGVFASFGNWLRCRTLEARNPGLRISGGVVCFGVRRIEARGRVFIERGVQLIARDGGSLIFGGDNYVLRDSQLVAGPNQKVLVGSGTTIDRNVIIGGNVVIGANCLIAPRVFISSGKHQFEAEPGLTIREQDAKYGGELGDEPVAIGENCWLGVNSVVLGGVVIGSNSILAANAVVTKSFPNGDQVLGGVPARVLSEHTFPRAHDKL